MKSSAGLAFVFMLVACESAAGEMQWAALNGCTQRWRIEFPELYGEKDATTQRRALAVMSPENIRFDEEGDFAFRQPPDRHSDSYDMQFICRGNIDQRTIELIGYDSVLERPEDGTVWRF